MVAALVALAALAGCIAPEEMEEVEAASLAPLETPGLREAPRLVQVPAGDSYTVLWLNATKDDWVDVDGETWLLRGFEFPEDAEMEAFSVLWLVEEDGKLRVTTTHLGNGGGAGGSGRGDDKPYDLTGIVVLQVVGAAAPFDMRFGAQEEMLDFELEGAPIPAEVVDQGDKAGLAWYFELTSPFGLVFGDEPFVLGFEADDTRVRAPGGGLGGAGTLSLRFREEVAGPSLHSFSGIARTFAGERAGVWSLKHTTDDETYAESGPFTGVFLPWSIVRSTPTTAVEGTFALSIAAETFPITTVHALTVPFDTDVLGFEVESESFTYGALPVIALSDGCLDLARPGAPSMAACRATEA